MTNTADPKSRDDTLLIQARDLWLQVRDAQGEGRRRADRVVQAARLAGHDQALVLALRSRGWAEREELAFADAAASLNEAVVIARRRRMSQELAEALATRASVRLEQGNAAAARRDIRAARDALGGGTSPEIDAQEAIIEDASGRLSLAARLYRSAIRRAGGSVPPETRFTLYNNLGVVQAQLGDLTRSRKSLQEALEIAGRVGRNKLGYATHNLAITALRGGDVAESLALFDEAEAIFRDVGMPLAEHYMERLDAFLSLRLLTEAADVADRAIRQLERTGFALLLGEARLRRARVKLALGDAHGAMSDATAAALELRGARGSVWQAQAQIVAAQSRLALGAVGGDDLAVLRRRAATLTRAGFGDEALEARLVASELADALDRPADVRRELERALALPAPRSVLPRIRRVVVEARLAAVSGDPVRARRVAARGLRVVARYRSSLPTTELRALAAAHGVEFATIGAELAAARSDPWGLLEWIERGRRVSRDVPPLPEGDDIQDAFARLRETSAAMRDVALGPDEYQRLAHEQLLLEARIQRRLRAAGPARDERRRVPTVRDAAHAVRDRTLIAFTDLRGVLAAVVVGPGGRATLHRLGAVDPVRNELSAFFFTLRRLVRAGSRGVGVDPWSALTGSLQRLDDLLCAPLRGAIEVDDRAVVVAPPAWLFAIPWHALPTLDGRDASVVPSLGLIARLPGRQRRASPVLVAGPALEAAESEVAAIAPLYPGARVLTGPAASTDAVASAMSGASIAHLACHGTFRGDNPSFSHLLLADGPLTVLDLERLSRPPTVVVLAACDSGVSEALPGDELVGLVGTMLHRGSRCVVASSVALPDSETSSLMVRFHRELSDGVGVAAALSRARQHASESDDLLVRCVALCVSAFGDGAVTV